MFEGLSLVEIEKRLFNTSDYKGWLSKTFLNYYGIDTEKENKGIYANKTLPDVVGELYQSSNVIHIRVAKIFIVFPYNDLLENKLIEHFGILLRCQLGNRRINVRPFKSKRNNVGQAQRELPRKLLLYPARESPLQV